MATVTLQNISTEPAFCRLPESLSFFFFFKHFFFFFFF